MVRALAERDPAAAAALAAGRKLVRNVVFMGMGEPFNNYPRVCGAVHALTHRKSPPMPPRPRPRPPA